MGIKPIISFGNKPLNPHLDRIEQGGGDFEGKNANLANLRLHTYEVRLPQVFSHAVDFAKAPNGSSIADLTVTAMCQPSFARLGSW